MEIFKYILKESNRNPWMSEEIFSEWMGDWASEFLFPPSRQVAAFNLTHAVLDSTRTYTDGETSANFNMDMLVHWQNWLFFVFYFSWQKEILPLSCSRCISLKYLPSIHPFICGDNRAHGFFVRFSWRFAVGMHNQSENQSEKQLQWLVCRWMAAMKSPLSALKASCGTGKRFKGLRRMRRWI